MKKLGEKVQISTYILLFLRVNAGAYFRVIRAAVLMFLGFVGAAGLSAPPLFICAAAFIYAPLLFICRSLLFELERIYARV